MTPLKSLTRWFDGLQPREQRVLRLGAPLILIILILGIVGWLIDARDAATQRWQRAVALEARLSVLLSGGRNTATPSNLLASARSEGGVTILPITDIPFEQVLDQIREWESRGGRIQTLQLSRTTDGRVSGEIRGTLNPP